jgi:adenylate kinase family enzyme
MKKLMRAHLARYPKMQAADMIKLLYQSEFAGGHLIADATDSLSRLICECRGLAPLNADSAFEDIGGGLCRIYLGALPALGLAPQTVNNLFVATANSVAGSQECFDKKLDEFIGLCQSGPLPFDADAVNAYIHEYRMQGRPPVSHSDAYRIAYSPAYRVVKASYLRYLEVFRRIDVLLDMKASITIAIDGNSGSGKSSLASLIAEVYDCNVFHTDDFFLPPDRKTADRLAEPGGNVDYERLRDEVVAGLNSGGSFQYRRYDCHSGVLGMPVNISPKRLNIVEGVYSLHPGLNMSYDLKIFLQVGSSVQRQRILERSGAAMLKRFDNEWIPLENRYFANLNIIKNCDLVYNSEFA